MPKVTGVGGVFFKSQDPAALREWYRNHMGVEVQPWGAQFFFNHRDRPGVGYTVWNPSEANTKYFKPREKPFMINLRVDDLEAMLALDSGAQVLDRSETGENGKFGYVIDPEGNLLELWEYESWAFTFRTIQLAS